MTRRIVPGGEEDEATREPLRRALAECDRKLARHRAALEASADPALPADKAEIYRQLGLRLTYDHETQTVLAETRPAPVGVLVVSEVRHDQYANALARRTRLVVG